MVQKRLLLLSTASLCALHTVSEGAAGGYNCCLAAANAVCCLTVVSSCPGQLCSSSTSASCSCVIIKPTIALLASCCCIMAAGAAALPVIDAADGLLRKHWSAPCSSLDSAPAPPLPAGAHHHAPASQVCSAMPFWVAVHGHRQELSAFALSACPRGCCGNVICSGMQRTCQGPAAAFQEGKVV